MSNKPKFSLEFNMEDIPWLFHALNIQHSTAMMYGEEGQKTKARVKVIQAALKEFHPILCNHDIEEYKFFDAMLALQTAKVWSIYQDRDYFGGRSWKPIVLILDDKVYPLTRSIDYNRSLLLALKEVIETYAPLDSKLQERDEPKVYRASTLDSDD